MDNEEYYDLIEKEMKKNKQEERKPIGFAGSINKNSTLNERHEFFREFDVNDKLINVTKSWKAIKLILIEIFLIGLSIGLLFGKFII